MINKQNINFIFKIIVLSNLWLLFSNASAESKILSRTIELKSDTIEEDHQSLQQEIRFLTKKVEALEHELRNLRNEEQSYKDIVSEKTDVTDTSELEKDIFSLTNKKPKDNMVNETVVSEVKRGTSTTAARRVTNDKVTNFKGADNVANKKLQPAETQEANAKRAIKNETESKKLYDSALGALKAKKYQEAEKKFAEFIKKYSNDPLGSNAYYWYAESYAKVDNYDKAAINYLKGYKSYPKGEKAADSLLKLSYSLEKLGKNNEAKQVLLKLKEEFPKRTASQIKATEDALMRINTK